MTMPCSTPSIWCANCGEPHNRVGQRQCHACHAKAQATYRHKLAIERRVGSRAVAYRAKRAGRIAPQPCQVCGSPASQMHHPDHELPTFVIWLCQEHHTLWHLYWKETVLKAFCEWVEIARECVAVRNSESAPVPTKRKAA